MPIKDLITSLEKIRESKVIVYMTGSKAPIFGTKIANDVLPFFRKVLEKFPEDINKISLFLDTIGGNLDTPWPLVNLIREYCKEFEVIIPEKALSAGTLIVLGADKIVMLPYSHLSPVDPATEIIDQEKKQQKRIEIEDIIGYINFAKDKIGIKNQAVLGDVMKELGREINPTILGSANRTHSLIRSLGRNLLSLHKEKMSDIKISKIVNHLTEDLFSHRHLINRKEAFGTIGFGEIIEFANVKTKRVVDSLFKFYLKYMEIEKQFDPKSIIGTDQQKDYKLIRAAVHSSDLKFNFISNYQLTKVEKQDGQVGININNNINKWEQTNI